MKPGKPTIGGIPWWMAALLILVAAGAVESWRSLAGPPEDLSEGEVEAALERASGLFGEEQRELLDRSRSLSATLAANLARQPSERALGRLLASYGDLWGISVWKGDSLSLWHGYPPPSDSGTQASEGAPPIRIAQENNVVYWKCQLPFSVRDSSGLAEYRLYTSKRILQTNPLPIGTGSEYHFTERLEDRVPLPLEVRLFNPLPDSVLAWKRLSTLEGDSAGAVFVRPDEAPGRSAERWEAGTQIWRTVYLLFGFLALGIAFLRSRTEAPPVSRLAAGGGLILLGWGLVRFLDLPRQVSRYMQAGGGEISLPVSGLLLFLADALALFLFTLVCHHGVKTYRRRSGPDSFLKTLSLPVLSGGVSSVLFLTLLNRTYLLLSRPGIPLDDLHLYPSVPSLLLYLGLGMMLGGLLLGLASLVRFTMKYVGDQPNLTPVLMVLGFSLALGGTYLVVPDAIRMDYTFPYGLLLFLALIAGIRLYGRAGRLYLLSSVRGLVIGTILVTLAAVPLIREAQQQRTDHQLRERARGFVESGGERGEQLTYELLSSLGETFDGINSDSLVNRQLFIGSLFNDTIDRFIASRSGYYSYDLRFITPDGVSVASYSTDLNSPSWPGMFSISQLKTVLEQEQITRLNLRPVVQSNPQLVTSKEYDSFYRGWIPVFGSSGEEPAAWILASVYREPPNFDKPLRAVLAALSYEDWRDTYSLLEYREGRLVRSSRRGITGYYPVRNRLPGTISRELESDSLLLRTEEADLYSYRTLYWNRGGGHVVRTSTILPGFRNRLYNYFRFNFTLLLLGLAVIGLRELLRSGSFRLFEKSRKFRYRLLDRFLLAVLIFLGILVMTTHYAIQQQNQEVVRQSLYQKMDDLGQQVQQQLGERVLRPDDRSAFLDSLTMPLEADASLYRGQNLVESTTPQIFRQHLLPDILPFDVHHRLYREGQTDAVREVTLASQKLLIGYRAVQPGDGEPVAAVAIPTFLQSPKFEEQLLETTSYLILIYLLIFGVFIIGSMLITRELTDPLDKIQQGLNELSRGNLDTRIPVSGDDEIGQLAAAYNEMVERLGEVRRELVVAEREAAWKEMAQQVAHEIKNPLTPMKLSVQHLQRQIPGDAKGSEELAGRIREITDSLIEQIETLNAIASDFSKFSKPLDREFEDVNLNAVLGSVRDLYSGDEKVEIELDTPPFPLIVPGQEDELRRVVVNLVKNAFEAMPDGGTVRLRSYRKKGSAFLEVEDSGTGIPEDHRDRLFVPSFSTKSSGTGLGLAISKKVVEAHGGSISFASIEGQGTTFVIKLPPG